MKKAKIIFSAVVVLVSGLAKAQDSVKNLPLVFDPQSKKYFIGGNSKFSIKAGDQSGLIDRIEVAMDGGEYRPYDQTIEFKQEGKHTLKFRAINPVNNWSPVQYVEVFVDLTPATTEASFDEEHYFRGEKDLFVGLKSSITLTAQDNLSGVANVEYSWDGSTYQSYSKPIVVEKLGHQTLYYRSTDKVGNVEPVKKMEFVADGTAPTSELKFGDAGKPQVVNGTTYVSDAVSFNLSSSDDLAKVKQIWVDLDGKTQPYIKPIYFLKEGPHSISFYSVDNVGNREQAKTISIYTVSTPPRTGLTTVGNSVNMGGINYANPGFQLKLSTQDNIVGTDRIEYKMNDEPAFHQYVEPITFRTPGTHVISFRAVDRTGNVEPAKAYTVSIVDTFPETKLTTAQPLITRDGVTYSPAPNVVTLNVSGGSGVGVDHTLISINDAPFAPYHGPVTLSNQEKIYKISYKSVDKLGNEEQAKTSTFHMIRAMPVVDLFITNGKSSEEQVRTNYLDQKDREPAAAAAPSDDAKPAPRKVKARAKAH